MGQALEIHERSAEVIEFPLRAMGRPAHKAARMATLMLVNEGMSQGQAAEAAGYSMGMQNSSHIVKSVGFQRAYTALQSKLQVELPFEVVNARDLYLEAHASATTTMEKLRAIDSLVKLYGLLPNKVVEIIEPTSREQMDTMSDAELKRIVDGN
ncbi:MAG: hypothetical protein MJK15_01825 [Colwellia sp.]|nr:hypothetical protein [Colwellia sp.]